MEKEKAGMNEPSNTEKEEPAKEVALKKEETEKKKPSNIAKKGPAEGDAIKKGGQKKPPETEKKGAAAKKGDSGTADESKVGADPTNVNEKKPVQPTRNARIEARRRKINAAKRKNAKQIDPESIERKDATIGPQGNI